jgi:hypothetical protein
MREVLRVERTGCQDGQGSKCLQEMAGECEGIAWVTAHAETSSHQRKNAYLSNTLLSQEDQLELLELYARKGNREGRVSSRDGERGARARGTGASASEGRGRRRTGLEDELACWEKSWSVGDLAGGGAGVDMAAGGWVIGSGGGGCQRRLAALTAASEIPEKPHLGIVTEIPDTPLALRSSSRTHHLLHSTRSRLRCRPARTHPPRPQQDPPSAQRSTRSTRSSNRRPTTTTI